MERVVGIVTAAGRGERAGGPKVLFRDASGRARASIHDGAPDVAVITPVDKWPAGAMLVAALISAVRERGCVRSPGAGPHGVPFARARGWAGAMDFDRRCDNISWTTVRTDTTSDASGRPVVVAVAKLALAFSATGELKLLTPAHRNTDVPDGGGGVRYPSDFAPFKPGTDVALIGSAHLAVRGRPPPTSGYAWLSVADRRKVVRIFGKRTFKATWQGIEPSEPEPIREPVPLRHDLAYGGKDVDESGQEVTFDLNPIGRGFSTKPERLHGRPAPQLVAVAADGTPLSTHAAFAPIPADWEPRRSLYGTVDAAWANARAPIPPRDFDPRHHLWSTPDLHFATPLASDVIIEVGGVLLEGTVRLRAPRYAVSFESESAGVTRPHPTHLDSVLVDADERVLELSWRVAIPLPRKWELLDRIGIRGEGSLPHAMVGLPPASLPSADSASAG